jgi:hypothetical protein
VLLRGDGATKATCVVKCAAFAAAVSAARS